MRSNRRQTPPSNAIQVAEFQPVSLSKRPEVEEELKQAASDFLSKRSADNTRRAYDSDFKQFTAWCNSMGYCALPATPSVIGLYITALSTGKSVGASKMLSSIRRCMSAIASKHRDAGHVSPVDVDVKALWKSIRRNIHNTVTKKKPLLDEHIAAIIERLPPDLQGFRDAALVSIGRGGAFRREEAGRMRVSWLTFGDDGLVVEMNQSKTNQMGEIEQIFIPRTGKPFCPVAALETWLDRSGIDDGFVFCQFTNKRRMIQGKPMTGDGVARVIKRLVKTIGLDPKLYSGHSMRRGFVSQKHSEGVKLEDIMETTRHQSYDTVLGYVEKDDVMKKIGKLRPREKK